MRDFEEDIQVVIDALPDKPQPSFLKPLAMGETVFCFEADWAVQQIEMRAYRTTGCKVTIKEVTELKAEVDCNFEKVG